MTEEYITKRKRKLSGKRLETFDKFWDIFHVGWIKRGRAEAADAWLDIPVLTDAIVADILLGAKAEAMSRQRKLDAGRTPKMAQGWITARRWEDETGDVCQIKPKISSSNGIDNMVRALNILTNCGEAKFKEFCKAVKMGANDIEAVQNKHNLCYDVNKLASGIG